MKLNYGPSGKIYFRGKTVTLLSTTDDAATTDNPDETDEERAAKMHLLEKSGNVKICYTPYIPVIIKSKIESIDVLNYPIQYADYDRLELDLEQEYEFDLLVYGFGRKVYSSRQVNLQLNILEMPPYLVGEYFNTGYSTFMTF